jgi:hypothetical protein
MSRFAVSLGLLLICASARVGAQSVDHSSFQTPPLFTTAIDVKAAQPPIPMAPLYASFAGLTAADGYLTWRAVHNGATEANRFIAPIAGDGARLAVFKVATGVVTVVASEQLSHQHPRTAMWMMVVANSGMMWVVWHNAQVAGLRR